MHFNYDFACTFLMPVANAAHESIMKMTIVKKILSPCVCVLLRAIPYTWKPPGERDRQQTRRENENEVKPFNTTIIYC